MTKRMAVWKPQRPITDWDQSLGNGHMYKEHSLRVSLYLFSILFVIHGWQSQQTRHTFGMGEKISTSR